MVGQITLTFKYSNDNGATWTSTKALLCTAASAFTTVEEAEGGDVITVADRSISAKRYPRVALMIKFHTNNFDSVTNPSNYAANYAFVQNMRAANLIHVYDGGFSGGIDGSALWTSSGNTNYMVTLDTPDPQFASARGSIIMVNMTLVTRKETDFA